MLSFSEKLQNYARLALFYGLGFGQKSRPLYVSSQSIEDAGGFLAVLGREAYKAGAPTIDVLYFHPELKREQFIGAPEALKLYIPGHYTARAKELVERDGANLALVGNPEIGIMDGIDPKYPACFRAELFKASEPFTSRQRNMLQPWTVMAVPSTPWAKQLGMTIQELWDFLFKITYADREDCVELALQTSKTLHLRCQMLNDLKISTLHFVGTGTDLRVGLSPRSRWLGGQDETEDGTWCGPNWPSFEVFTTPDWRLTEGIVRMTMPVVLQGPIVKGLVLEFSRGRIVKADAEEGQEAYRAMISHDEGASQVGEIALVGLDAPLSAYPEPHYHTLLDENKRGHLATGSAYAFALEDGQTASKEELAELGCNSSATHTDIMITDETTDVYALDSEGKRIAQLLKNGRWTEPFAQPN